MILTKEWANDILRFFPTSIHSTITSLFSKCRGDGATEQLDWVARTGTISPDVAEVVLLDSTAGSMALALSDAVKPKHMKIIMTVDGGDAVITPDNYLNGTTITLDDAGDSIALYFDGTQWLNVGTPTATVA